MAGGDWYSERFCNRTLAILADLVSNAYTHSELDNLFQRLDAVGEDENEWGSRGNKLDRCHNVVDALNRRDPEGGIAIIELLRELLEIKYKGRVLGISGTPIDYFRPLLDSLRGDGYEFADGRLVPSTSEPAPLAPELSLLEHELKRRGLHVALQHYRQAVDSFAEGRLEASNGQLRATLEDMTTTMCQRLTNRMTTDPRGAVQSLRAAGHLDGDEARLLDGLIGISNPRGAHSGLTDEEEATFRLHFTTAAARYLLARLPDSVASP